MLVLTKEWVNEEGQRDDYNITNIIFPNPKIRYLLTKKASVIYFVNMGSMHSNNCIEINSLEKSGKMYLVYLYKLLTSD